MASPTLSLLDMVSSTQRSGMASLFLKKNLIKYNIDYLPEAKGKSQTFFLGKDNFFFFGGCTGV
jgi:hypothetical protein